MSFRFDQVRVLILPNLEAYLLLLEPEMQLEKQKNALKRQQAWKVYGALLVSSSYKINRLFPLNISLADYWCLEHFSVQQANVFMKRPKSTAVCSLLLLLMLFQEAMEKSWWQIQVWSTFTKKLKVVIWYIKARLISKWWVMNFNMSIAFCGKGTYGVSF